MAAGDIIGDMEWRTGRVHQVNVSPTGGVPKRAVPEAYVGVDGLHGDSQRNLKHHGGPNRAVCLYALERIETLRGEGHPIEPGSVGENLTLEGIDWSVVTPGVRIHVGNAVELEVVKYTEPCKTISGSFKDGQIDRIRQERHPGFSRVYARVLREGVVRPGDAVRLQPLTG